MNRTDQQLWQTLLWATYDDNGEPLDKNYDFDSVDPDNAAALNAAYWQWRDAADAVMIRHGIGVHRLEYLLGADRVEHCYVLARDGHGVAMTDHWLYGAEWNCCQELDSLASAQGPIGAYVGDDSRIYCSWSF